jgi:hypothetical protein
MIQINGKETIMRRKIAGHLLLLASGEGFLIIKAGCTETRRSKRVEPR